jgi:hypothetical protein
MLAIIGGDPVRFQPFVELYHRALAELGTGPGLVGQHSPGHVAETDDERRRMTAAETRRSLRHHRPRTS